MAGNNGHENLRIGVYVCHCGSNIAGVIDPEVVAEFASTLPGVVRAINTPYACADSGQNLIKEDMPDIFFTLASGLGLPYIVLGTFSGMLAALPRAGTWMKVVK